MENVTEDLGNKAVEKIDATRAPLADALEGAATTVRRQAPTNISNLDTIAFRTAGALGTAAGYIRTHDVQEMMADAEDAARRNPVPSLAGAAALGFLLGAFLRRD